MSCDYISSETLESELRNNSFIINNEFLAKQSPITGGEKLIREFNLDDNIVKRYDEFLQGRDYSVSASDEESEGEDEDEDGELGQSGVMTPDTVQSLADQEDLRPGDLEEWRPRDRNVLRVHAKMYAVAQYKGFDALRTTALQGLKTALEEIDGPMSNEAEWRVMANIFELFDYVYSHTDLNSREPMRSLVSTFAAENLESLTGHEDMEFLLVKRGGFAVELVEKVVERLSVVGKEVQKWKSQAAASDDEVRQLKLAIVETMKGLQVINTEKMGELAATHEATIRELAIINTEKMRELEATHEATIRELAIINTEKMRELEATHEVTIRGLAIINTEKVRELEATNEARVRELTAINTKMKGLEITNEARVRELVAINMKMKELEIANEARAGELFMVVAVFVFMLIITRIFC